MNKKGNSKGTIIFWQGDATSKNGDPKAYSQNIPIVAGIPMQLSPLNPPPGSKPRKKKKKKKKKKEKKKKRKKPSSKATSSYDQCWSYDSLNIPHKSSFFIKTTQVHGPPSCPYITWLGSRRSRTRVDYSAFKKRKSSHWRHTGRRLFEAAN